MKQSLKGLGPLVAGLALASSPLKSDAATVYSSIFQDSGESAINYTLINNDDGATYNSATLDLNAILGSVVNNIVSNNPAYDTAAEVYANMGLNITQDGNVSGGWGAEINSLTGLASITNNNFSYDAWTSDSNQNTLTGTLNLGNMLDYDGNGIIDQNETLAFTGIANNAFIGYDGAIGFQANADRITVIPEPSSALLGGLALGGALLRRRREQSTDSYNPLFPALRSGHLR